MSSTNNAQRKSAGERLTIEDQLAMMREGHDAPMVFEMGSMPIQCRILTASELVRIEQDVQIERVKMEEGGVPWTEDWMLNRLRQITLERATKLEGEPVGTLTHDLLDRMSFDEVCFAYGEYLSLLRKVNPMLDDMSDEEVTELIEAVKKDPSLLSECTSTQLRRIITQLLQVAPEASLPDRSSG